jgi:CzcA family heavy metal efflux pump
MMRWIVASALRFRFIAVGLAVGMLLFGGLQLRAMPVDVFPEFAPPRVEVQTAAVGLSAAETEALITVPLEEALNGVSGLDVMRSKSVSQLSSIELIFEEGTDLLEARQLVQERVATVTPTLPPWATPPVMIQPLSATSRVMKIGLSSDELSLIEMSQVAYYNIRARLLRVPGVANVAIWGRRQQQLQVQVKPRRLRAEEVPLSEVMTRTSDALDAGLLQYTGGAVVGTGGFIDTPNQRLGVTHVLPILSARDLARVTVATHEGGAVRLGDVARVVNGHQPLIGDAVINDGPGLMLIVEKLPWGNTLRVTNGVEDAIDELRPGLRGIDIDTTIFRPATFIETSLHNLRIALLLGCLLVVLVLSAFLLAWRTALISVVAIPLSLLAAALVLYFSGATTNTMVLAGLVIAVGVVVDDAIIDIENIMRRLREARRECIERSTASTILEASLEVRGPIIYATLIIIVAAVPVFFLEGLTGSFFRPLAMSYTLAVLASMVVALTVTPALALILLGRAPLDHREPPLVRYLQRGYQRVLSRIVTRPSRAYALSAVIALVGVVAVPQLGQSLLPEFKERDFLMHWLTTPGTSQPEMVRISTRASRELRAIRGVRNFGAHIGQADAADEVVGMYFGENWISVAPEADYDRTLARIQKVVAGYPGLFRDVQTYLKERIREVLTGASGAIVVRVSGPDLAQLRTTAEEVRVAMSRIDGLIDEHVNLQLDIPQIEVEVDLVAAHRHGVKPGDVRRAASAMVNSIEVNDIWRQGKAYDVNVLGVPSSRNSVSSVLALPIDTPSGVVPLSAVADVRVEATPNVIERDDGTRRIDVEANVQGRDLGAVVADVERAVASVDFPTGYHPEIIGEFAERQAAQQRLLVFAGVALLGIFLLLHASFGSLRLAVLAIVTLPMALVGGILAAWLGDGVVSLGSLVGFFTVMGIAARNGILLINHCQHLEQYEGETFGPGLVLRGARERLAPILMTTLATGLALVPLVVAGQIPGHEIEHPMAVVILGGLATSTLLNLFVVPSLYLRFSRRPAATAAA